MPFAGDAPVLEVFAGPPRRRPGGAHRARAPRARADAEGRSNAGIADALVVTGGTVEKHVASIFDKLGLPPDEADNRRVLAVPHHLGS